jgi:hypothetical protein
MSTVPIPLVLRPSSIFLSYSSQQKASLFDSQSMERFDKMEG